MLGSEEKVIVVMCFGFLTILFTEFTVHACHSPETQLTDDRKQKHENFQIYGTF